MSASNPYDVSPAVAPRPEIASAMRSLHLKKIDVLSSAKLFGTFYALIAFLFGLFFSVIALVGMAAGGGNAVMGGLITGVGAIILLPLIYGIGGFLFGVVAAFLYNLVASMVGGLILHVEV